MRNIQPALYTLLDGDTYAEHLVELETATPGLTLYRPEVTKRFSDTHKRTKVERGRTGGE